MTRKPRAHSHTHSAPSLENVLAAIKAAGLKITAPRKAILQAFVGEHGPFTAEEIHTIITKRVCDLATVYRTLGSLEEAGILKRCDFKDSLARYELAEPGHAHHHHIICNKCRRIEIIEDHEVAHELDRLGKKMGYAEVSHSLEFFGICPQCR